jgi:hypothetical protein
MKNKRQVLAYLKIISIAGEKDELAIESYLSRKGIILQLDKFVKIDTALNGITFEAFTEWFESDLPDRNEVIVLEESGTIGIIKGLCVNTIVLGVSLPVSGTLVSSEVKIENTAYRQANTEEKVRLQRALNKKKVTWNNSNSKLLDAVKLLENLQLRVSLLGERVAIGVFREINNKGEIVMYCVKENDKPVRYNLSEVVGNSMDYQLEPVSAQERKTLALELEKAGKIWNGHAKRIEPVNFRAGKGVVYYYIDDFMEIVATADKEKPKDLKRFRSGNYFRDRNEAKDMLDLINGYRKEQLVNFTNKQEKKKNIPKK